MNSSLKCDGPVVITDPETGRQYVVVPTDMLTTEHETVTGIRGNTCYEEIDAASLLALVNQRRQEQVGLERECDLLAEQLSQSFEELTCLQRVASTLAESELATDHRKVVSKFLRTLLPFVRAEVVLIALPREFNAGVVGEKSRVADRTCGKASTAVIECLHGVPDMPDTDGGTPSGFGQSAWLTIQAGEHRFASDVLLAVVEEISRMPDPGVVVYNRYSGLKHHHVSAGINGLVAVPLVNHQSNYGWLLAVDRVQSPEEGVTTEFGSQEASLLSTAACMLAGHLRNSELFHAEERLRLGVIESIVEALDARDPYTCGHSRRVGQIAERIGGQLGLSREAQEKLYITGLLHDVGKIGVPDGILRKDGKLTDEEFDVIKQHPRMGYDILLPLKSLSYVLPGVLHHHERIDGRGYPDRLAGEEIPIDARILAVADSYDAMTSDRAYRAGMPVQRAIEILNSGRGTQWDAAIVDAFLKVRSSEEQDSAPVLETGR